MTLLGELMDETLLDQMITEKYVRVQHHPALPYAILNYTEKTQFDRNWNEVTRQCRGLIVNHDTNEIVARPFPKFFNYGEDQTSQSFDDYRNSPVTVTDKLDGSLGILYPVPGGWQIATRGSFTSPQALHGSQRLWEYLKKSWEPMPGTTYLFEIIYPDNRIVCDYGGMDELVLLGMVNVEAGWTTGPFDHGWPGPKAMVFNYASFEDALAAQPRPGAEGLVVHFHERDMRLKLKQPDYVLLHRIVTGLNERRVWELMADGVPLEEIMEPLPEEFHDWTRKVYNEIQGQWYTIYDDVLVTYGNILAQLPADWRAENSRKDFALLASRSANSAMLFRHLDGKDFAGLIWQRVKPEFSRGPWQRGEDNA